MGYLSLLIIQKINSMLNYNQEVIVDSDTHRCGSYYANVYEFPFPEMPILKERDKEMNRLLRKPIITMRSDSNNCQKGD